MTDGDMTIVAAIEIPSTNPVFLTIVGVHVLLGLACAVTGAIAMLSEKRSTAGEIIARCLSTGTELKVRQFPSCIIPPGGICFNHGTGASSRNSSQYRQAVAAGRRSSPPGDRNVRRRTLLPRSGAAAACRRKGHRASQADFDSRSRRSLPRHCRKWIRQIDKSPRRRIQGHLEVPLIRHALAGRSSEVERANIWQVALPLPFVRLRPAQRSSPSRLGYRR